MFIRRHLKSFAEIIIGDHKLENYLKMLGKPMRTLSFDTARIPFSREIYNEIRTDRISIRYCVSYLKSYFNEPENGEEYNYYVYKNYYNKNSFKNGMCSNFIEYYLRTGKYLDRQNGPTAKDIRVDSYREIMLDIEFPYKLPFKSISTLFFNGIDIDDAYSIDDKENVNVNKVIYQLKDGVYQFNYKTRNEERYVVIKDRNEIIIYDPTLGTYRLTENLPETKRLDIFKCVLKK